MARVEKGIFVSVTILLIDGCVLHQMDKIVNFDKVSEGMDSAFF